MPACLNFPSTNDFFNTSMKKSNDKTNTSERAKQTVN